MDFVNWILVGFWGCAILLALQVFLIISMVANNDDEQPTVALSIIVSFIGMCCSVLGFGTSPSRAGAEEWTQLNGR